MHMHDACSEPKKILVYIITHWRSVQYFVRVKIYSSTSASTSRYRKQYREQPGKNENNIGRGKMI